MHTPVIITKAKMLAVRYERHLGLIAFFAGFAIDNLTLPGSDRPASQIVVIGYLAAATALFLVERLVAERPHLFRGRITSAIVRWIPALLPFCFGAVFSALFVFYMRSASVEGSWFFLILFSLAALGNELGKEMLAATEYRFATLFLLLYMYFVYAIPLLLGTIGATTFFLSGFAALLAGLLLIGALRLLLGENSRDTLIRAVLAMLGILLVFEIGYAGGLLPPIPLVLKDIGIYHSIDKVPDGGYRATVEEDERSALSLLYPQTIHVVSGASLAAWSAAYTPATLTTPIIHRWEKKDIESGRWTEKLSVSFPVTGGRAKGYRGYSEKLNVDPGEWRVIVETADGRRLGSIRFWVAEGEASLRQVTR